MSLIICSSGLVRAFVLSCLRLLLTPYTDFYADGLVTSACFSSGDATAIFLLITMTDRVCFQGPRCLIVQLHTPVRLIVPFVYA
jgi:hypothetical protein